MSISDLYYQLFGRTGTNKGTDIDMAEHGRAGGVSTGQPFKFVDGIPMAYKITTVGSDTYIGVANPGTAQSAALWQAFKYGDGVLTYADGNAKFDNVATDLTSLSYS